jgi:AMP phosphorylase
MRLCKKTIACLVWGGSLELAAADDLFIQVEYPLGIDPDASTSILSKKKAIGATHVAIDIPTGVERKSKHAKKPTRWHQTFVDLANASA